MKTVSVDYEVYSYAELNTAAKENARQNYIEHIDWPWWEETYKYLKNMCKNFGLEITDIWFSGFYSQGDGACFEGTYTPQKENCLQHFTEIYPSEIEISKIVSELNALENKDFLVRIYHQGRYYHENSVYIEISYDDENLISDQLWKKQKEIIEQNLKALMQHIYSMLESVWDWKTSETIFKDLCELNEWYFLKNGELFNL